MRGVRTLGLLAILALLLPPGVAQAGGPEPMLTLEAPAQGTLGETAVLAATLLAPHGSPIAGVPIQFLSLATFLSQSGDMLLGQATTDARGVAVFLYEPRREEEVRVIARFAGNADYGRGEAFTTIAVQGSAQLYQEEVGVQVPGIGVWLLAAILGAVWSTYFTVFLLVTRIAHEGAPRRGLPGVMQ